VAQPRGGLWGLTAEQLREECRVLGVRVTGAKEDLVTRLLERDGGEASYDSLALADLKGLLRNRSLRVSGTKAELAERLRAFDRQTEAPAAHGA